MTPFAFIEKWRDASDEHAVAQPHFVELCRMLGVDDPQTADPQREWFCFERGAKKAGGGSGWADVWRRGCFGWEYKSRGRNLDEAHAQLLRYSGALETPPLLITCDFARYRIHTNWTNTVQQVHAFAHEDLVDAAVRDRLRFAFTDPDRLKPAKTRQQLTEEAAAKFVALADRLRARGHDPQAVAHFVNRLVFCMFAEDVGLLPNKLFQKAMDRAASAPEKAEGYLARLFAAMREGGEFGLEDVPWFNGGLFDDDAALALERADVTVIAAAARLDWADIDPSILGTLFERGLDPEKRSQLGAHYTDRDKIMLILDPVVVRPLMREWKAAKTGMVAATERERAAREKAARTPNPAASGAETRRANAARAEAEALHTGFIERLRAFRVLDPACGSGNFLYLALRALKDIELQANLDAAEIFSQPVGFPTVGPESVRGIEINPFAAELARVSVWIGEIQWMRRHGFDANRNPILRPLDMIECRDAVLNPDGAEAAWPEADAIVGNPPFLGAKLMKQSLGRSETERIRTAFAGRLPGFTDLVCYWFEKARAEIVEGRARRVGLVATNSIAKNTNLPVLRRIVDDTVIVDAHADEPWVVNGAAVRVALVTFVATSEPPEPIRLNGTEVAAINPNLTSGLDLSRAAPLSENRGGSMLGIQKSGPFDVDGETAREWMRLPLNPNGRRNSEVLRPYWNGDDLTSRPRDVWFIDLPRGLSEGDVALWDAPFTYLARADYEPDKPDGVSLRHARQGARDHHAQERWWEPYWPRPEMRRQIETLNRYIVTAETAEYRLFVWLQRPILPDKNLIVFPRDDDTAFGILQSRAHELWSLAIGSSLEDRPRYTSSTTFETFPFPEGLTPDIPSAAYADDPRAQRVAEAARLLNDRREAWLNPPDLVHRVPEIVQDFPDRLLPVSPQAEAELRRRTLTNLYNARPPWLDLAHRALDEAVAEAYGWGEDWRAGRLTDDETLARLFALNQSRAAR